MCWWDVFVFQCMCVFLYLWIHMRWLHQFLLTLSCLLFSFSVLSKVYFSERLWRILKRREPRFEARDSSSSMMSWGTLTFFPRSISISGHKETSKPWKSLCIQYMLVNWSDFWQDIFICLLSSHLLNLIEHKLYSHRKKSPLHGLLTWYSCQHDKWEMIFPRNPLMSSACFVVSAAC